MANYAARGNGREVAVARLLEQQGWVVGSRRHIGGAGDLLAVHARHRPRLIEVKSSTASPWAHFGPADRKALSQTARSIGADALLAWHPPRATLAFIEESRWPDAGTRD